jgi:polyphosphate kinase 2 (PPK2 family)
MPDPTGLPSLWTHEPHNVLAFRAGDKVVDIDPNATPGFTGGKEDAPALQDERNARYAGLQEMLYANSREGDTRSVLLVLQGMDSAGKGGHRQTRCRRSQPAGHPVPQLRRPHRGRAQA